jgi:hypothetical protein
MRDKQAQPSARASAANSILDRARGKPIQSMMNLNRETIGELSDEEISGYLAALRCAEYRLRNQSISPQSVGQVAQRMARSIYFRVA